MGKTYSAAPAAPAANQRKRPTMPDARGYFENAIYEALEAGLSPQDLRESLDYVLQKIEEDDHA